MLTFTKAYNYDNFIPLINDRTLLKPLYNTIKNLNLNKLTSLNFHSANDLSENSPLNSSQPSLTIQQGGGK